VEEVGTNLPTVVAPDATPRFNALVAGDPELNWQGLSARVAHIFTEFQTAWAARNLAAMRPFLSDSLFSTQTYWVEEYLRQGLRNITENARIQNMQLAQVTSDAFYDAVTIRLWASSLDYTVSDRDNRIVSGNRSRERAYSEYWTVIRGHGVRGAARVDKVCPKCGAPLNVSMAGACTYCSAKVTGGGFDWVLSRIEQDEVYRG
jgi:predicted lipid-binding transport protein (Tim44 family)